MYAFQENKKQTEELNSSKIQETIVSYQKAMVQLKELYTEGLLSGFKFHTFCDQLHEATFALLANYSSFGDYMSSCSEFDDVNFSVQSGEGLNMDPTSTTDGGQEQNVGFSDPPNNVILSIPHDMSKVKVDTSQNVELGDFLKRPVQIFNKTWAIGDTIDLDSFEPWHLFFNKTSIKKKLDNYYLLRCNLHLKFIINASPFYYGCCIVGYQPLTSFNPAPLVISSADKLENICLSQRPHIYIYPQDSQGGEMVLPFLFHKNWLNATDASELQDMGTIQMNSFAPLLNANGLTSDSIEIVCYAWAEDVEISGPTVSLAVQSDEYSHAGAVSKPASAIARAAGHLSDLPVIGPFATATSYAAGAVADIASLFGYTNVPVIDDVHAFKSKPFPNMASTDIGTPVEKLSLDAKNELTVDPSVSGANVNDELMLSDFVQRESFLYSNDWLASDTLNTSLMYCKVSPHLVRHENGTHQKIVWSTPMAHAASCFKYWRGDITFRLKFICTKYHRGRVRINWDPFGDIGTTGDYTTETYTKIVDIQEETDVSFTIPYTQATAFLEVPTNYTNEITSASTSTSKLGLNYNGIVTVRVLNKQSSPVASANIKMLVFAKGCDNLEFGGPREISNLISPYAVQSGELDQETSEFNMGIKESTADPNINLVYMGESCVSLRQLMRRQVGYMRIASNNNTTTEYHVTSASTLSRSPLYPGFDSTGLTTAIGLSSTTSKPYNWVNWNYATWFSTCFVGSRGSYIYNLNSSYIDGVDSVTISRAEQVHTSTQYMIQNNDLPLTNRNDFVRRFCDTSDSVVTGLAGLTLTNQRSQAGLSALLPMYSRYKFLSNNVLSRTEGDTLDGTDLDAFKVTSVSNSYTGVNSKWLYHDLYCSIGTDFSLIFFLNAPVLFHYNSMPTAV